MKRFSIFCIGLFSCQALTSSALDRAQGAAFVPSFRVNYVYEKGLSHMVWASLAWDIDEILSGDKKIAAIQLERLEREAERLKFQNDLEPSIEDL
jgi:hypothetical protein